jgi:threonine dehydratase
MTTAKQDQDTLAEWADRVEEAQGRIRDVVVRTEVRESTLIAPDFDGKVWLKLEHRQRTGSFKLRGAANRIESLTPDEVRAGVTTSSMGNHGLGVAHAGQVAGVPVEVFVSPRVAEDRSERMRASGATIRTVEGSVLDAELAARAHASRTGRVYVSPYNDPHVVAGQGTIGLELLEDLDALDTVFVAVGGGGLIGGIGAYLKARAPHVEVVGCWPENAPALHACLEAGRIVDVAEEPTLSESTAGGVEEGSITFELARRVIDRSVLVTEDEILAAMRLLEAREGWVVEGAAGVALAAFLKSRNRARGRQVAIVLCGGNVSPAVRLRMVG